MKIYSSINIIMSINELSERLSKINILQQKKGLKRNTIDKFYTKENIVNQCLEAIKSNLNILEEDLILEPSAGNGVFINKIKTLSNNYKFYDIEPEHDDIIKQDFLELDTNNLKNQYKNIHIIGNPPFGRQSSLAINFIKKCCLFANSISFILPKSFKKDSMKKYFTMNYHLIYQINIPINSFTYFGITKNIKTVFQIWIRKDKLRKITQKLIPSYWYSFTKKENSTISIRRVGSKIGYVKITEDSDNINTHWFIKINNSLNIKILNLLIKLNNINFNKDNNVGALSISKQDIIKKYNKLSKEFYEASIIRGVSL